MVQSILLGAAKACSSQEHREKSWRGLQQTLLPEGQQDSIKAENRINSLSQYLCSILLGFSRRDEGGENHLSK